MRTKFYFFLFLTLHFLYLHAQKKGLILSENIKKETTSFEFIKNLVIVPVSFNGQQMNFIIDSGLKETILFSEYNPSINKENLRQITLKGLGNNSINTTGYFSTNNHITIGKNYSSKNMDIIVIQDENFNLFSRLGMDVHGIIGADFFINYPINIDYAKRKITIYNSINNVKKLNKFQANELEISEESKPFIAVDFTHEKHFTNQKMLIDIGNSDGLWIFKNQVKNLTSLHHAFHDELGKGFNGVINGERGTISSVNLGKYNLKQPLIAVPSYESIQYLNLKNERKGSIGNEILRRFSVILDYKNKRFYFKPNRNFKDAFHYNRSGLTIIHDQFEWKNEKIDVQVQQANISEYNTVSTQKVNYKYILKPVYKIESVRKNSNAEMIGLKANDQLIKLNGKDVSKMSMDDIETFMRQNEFQQISIEVLRNKQALTFKFVLDIPY